jgi:hypothetical protein
MIFSTATKSSKLLLIHRQFMLQRGVYSFLHTFPTAAIKSSILLAIHCQNENYHLDIIDFDASNLLLEAKNNDKEVDLRLHSPKNKGKLP